MEPTDKTISTLDGIIREITAMPKRKEAHIQVIIINARTGEIAYEQPFDPFRLLKLRYFELHMKSALFNIQGPLLSASYENAEKPFKVAVRFNARIIPGQGFKLVRFMNGEGTPLQLLNTALQQEADDYIFQYKDFVINFSQHGRALSKLLSAVAERLGLELDIQLQHQLKTEDIGDFFFHQHIVKAQTNDGQTVEIRHDLALTLTDRIKYALSGIKDIKQWVQNKLDQYTSNAVIELSYAQILTNMDQSLIKAPMNDAVRKIGYELKQMISVPGLDNEKFFFETADDSHNAQKDYSTKDTKFRISVNMVVSGKLDLHHPKTSAFIKPDFDIIDAMKKKTIESARAYLIGKTPHECFLQFSQLEIDLINHVRNSLEAIYGFHDLNISVQSLESNLSDRFFRLQEKPFFISFDADLKERGFELGFQVSAVADDGWFRFRGNNYADTQDELAAIGRGIQGIMNTAMFHRSGLIDKPSIEAEFGEARKWVIMEFGLEIRVHSLTERISEKTGIHIEERLKDNEMKAMLRQYLRNHSNAKLTQLLQEHLEASRNDKERAAELQQEIDREIQGLTTGRESLTSSLHSQPRIAPDGNSDTSDPQHKS